MDRRPNLPDSGAARPAAPQVAGGRERAAAPPRRSGTERFRSGPVALSLLLHAGAAAAVAAGLAWRTAPHAPPSDPAMQVVWLDSRPLAEPSDAPPSPVRPDRPDHAEDAPVPLSDSFLEGLEPEDALATMIPDPPAPADPATTRDQPPDHEQLRAEAPPPPAPLRADAEAPELPSEPPPPEAGPTERADRPETPPEPDTAFAALSVPPPPIPQAEAALPRPTLPATPARRERPRPSVRQPVPPTQAALRNPEPPRAAAAPPAPTVPDQAPLVRGLPRFRRPPPPPVYPAQAQDRGDEGAVALRLLVGADGGTREIRLFRSSGNRLLDDAAMAAARRWEIEPASIDGRPTEAWVEVPVRFRLDR